MKKADLVRTKSDPAIAAINVKRLLGDEAQLYFSTRKNKKYMVYSPADGWVHFGDINSEDYTLHQDEERRRRFQQRNANWKDAAKWTPAWLSYHILW